MRIQSRFKDYYDSLQSTDREDVLYVRATTEHRRGDFERDYPHHWAAMKWPSIEFTGMNERGYADWMDTSKITSYVTVVRVFFCGKCYPAIQLFGNVRRDDGMLPAKSEVFYTKDSFLGFVKNKGASFWNKEAHNTVKNWTESYSNQRLFDIFFTEIPQNDELFRLMGAPVFILTRDQVLVDPRLTDWCFARHIHLVRAYQELDMYLGNALAARKEIGWVGDDRVRAEQHGFDKHSFRNVAPGGKARKQAKKLAP